MNHFGWRRTQILYSSIAAPKTALVFKIYWSTLISVFVAHATIITIAVTVTVSHRRSPPPYPRSLSPPTAPIHHCSYPPPPALLNCQNVLRSLETFYAPPTLSGVEGVVPTVYFSVLWRRGKLSAAQTFVEGGAVCRC